MSPPVVCAGPRGVKAKSYSVRIQGNAVVLALAFAAAAHSEGTDRRRFGTLGHLSWFVSREPVDYSLTERVDVRTSRSLKAGEILNWEWQPRRTQTMGLPAANCSGEWQTKTSCRIGVVAKERQRAFDACRQLLAKRKMPVELIDVEQRLGEENIIFHFLGDPPSEMADLTQELADQYDARVEFRQFMERVDAGCGSGCGSDDAPGCGAGGKEGGCGEGGGCAIAESPRKRNGERT